jgi:hypothetical protein
MLFSRQRIGAGGPTRGRGLFPAFDRWHDAGQLSGDQVANHPHAVQASVEQKELHAATQDDQALQESPYDMRHRLLGSHPTARQGRAAPLDHGIGRGIGEKMRRATFGFAAADFVLRGLSHGSMVGQYDPIHGDVAPACAQPLRHQACQAVIAMAFERIQVAALTGQCAQHRGSRWGTLKLMTGLMDRELRGRGKDQDLQQVATLKDTGHVQGQRVQYVDSEVVYVLALQGIQRICRHGALRCD